MDRRDLEARTAAFARAAFDLSNLVRPMPGGRGPADQLLDCATSVGANYRASGRARSPDEFIAKLGIVNEEADEAVYWLELIRDVRLAGGDRLDGLLAEARELRAISSSACRTARRNRRNRKIR